jgi:hypothetical protein
MKQSQNRASGKQNLLLTSDRTALKKTPNIMNIQASKLDAKSKPSVKRLLNQKKQPNFIVQQSDQTELKDKLL